MAASGPPRAAGSARTGENSIPTRAASISRRARLDRVTPDIVAAEVAEAFASAVRHAADGRATISLCGPRRVGRQPGVPATSRGTHCRGRSSTSSSPTSASSRPTIQTRTRGPYARAGWTTRSPSVRCSTRCPLPASASTTPRGWRQPQLCAVAGTPPHLDLVVLGVGPDGHVASLFPGPARLARVPDWVIAVHDAPKPPPDRLSLGLAALTGCARDLVCRLRRREGRSDCGGPRRAALAAACRCRRAQRPARAVVSRSRR